MVWKDQNGTEKDIACMYSNHLINVWRYLINYKRLSKKQKMQLLEIEKELEDRGYNIKELLEEEVKDIFEDYTPDEIVEYFIRYHDIRLYTKNEVKQVMFGACQDGKQGYDPYDLLIEDYL